MTDDTTSAPLRARRRQPRRRAGFDVWLTRVGTISNIVLAAFAVVGFFYTVVPLYRLAATDNELARRGLELSRMQARLDTIYGQVRAHSIGMVLFRIGPKCTGLMEPAEGPRVAEAYADPNGEKLRQLHAEPPFWRRILEIDFTSCALADLERSPLDQLTAEDREAFIKALKHVVSEIDADRKRSLLRAQNAFVEARANPKILPDDGPFVSAVTQLLSRYEQESPEAIFARRVENLQFQIAVQWADRARARLIELGTLKRSVR